jgi:peptidoglycan/LPS O-acetylase OafA/YrhL
MAVIQSLQVFRGLAALAVVAHHGVISTNAFVGLVPAHIVSVLGGGYLGVDFFFVLSGFIIMYTHMSDTPSIVNVRRYVLKRLVRIFPPYLPLSIGMLLLYAALPGFSESGGRDYSLLSSLFLLPADLPPALSVAWTLVHEIQFYAIFLLFYLSGRLLISFLLLWASVILFANLTFVPSGWASYPLSLMNIEFMFGVLAAWIVKGSKLRIPPSIWMAAGTALSLAMLAYMQPNNLPSTRLVFAFGLALVVVGFALLERNQILPWPTILLLLGNASYSIYLIHNPLLSLTQRLAGRFEFDWLMALMGGVVISILVGLIYYKLIECPALSFFRSRFNR